jgi:putative transposase
VYQGRFKSFPVQQDDHYFTVCRYVERNPLRANLVARAEHWRWSSLWHRVQATPVPWLSAGPLPWPEPWTEQVNRAQTEGELEALRRSVRRGAPFGSEPWQAQAAVALGLESALRRPGRPTKRQGSSDENLT